MLKALLEWVAQLLGPKNPSSPVEIKPIPQNEVETHVPVTPEVVEPVPDHPKETAMKVSETTLLTLFPEAKSKVGEILPALNAAMQKYEINTPKRVACFLAQVGHESGHLVKLVENLNYSADGLAATWPNRYRDKATGKPNALAQSLHRKPEAIANNVYAKRMGNGDEASGDGWRYRGRSLIHVTGKDNYLATGIGIGINLLNNPELLERYEYACIAAAWWWHDKKLNQVADLVTIDHKSKVSPEYQAMTKTINGGLNGYADRETLLRKAWALIVFGV